MAAFTPLIIFRNSFSPFNFGKVVVFRSLIEILLVFYVVLVLLCKEARFWNYLWPLKIKDRINVRGLLLWAIFIYTFSYSLSTFLGVNWHQSFWGYWERMGGLFSWLHYAAFVIIAVSVLRKKEEWLEFLFLMVLAAFISAFFGLLQKFNIVSVLGATGRFRIFGTLGNPAAFAGYLIFNFFFAVFLLREFSSRRLRFFLFSSLILFGLGIIMTAVRGALLGFGVGLLILAAHSMPTFKNYFKINKIRAVILVALFAVSFFGIWRFGGHKIASFSYFERLSNLSFEQATIKQRLIVWQIALSGIKERPIFGWGPENFGSVFSAKYDPKLYNAPDDVLFDRAHNAVLDIAVTQGIVGLLAAAFLGIMAFFAIHFSEFPRFQKGIFYSLLAAYSVQNLFFFDLFSTFLMLSVLLGFLVAAGGKSELSHALNLGARIPIKQFAVLLPLFFGAIFTIYYVNIRPALANFYTTRSYVFLNKGEVKKGMGFASKALENAQWSEHDVSRKLAEGIGFSTLSRVSTDKEFDDTLNKMAAALKANISRNRLDYSEYIYLNRFSKIAPGSFKETWETLESGIEKMGRLPFLYFELFDLFVDEGDWENARRLMDRALSSGLDLPEIKFRLGVANLKIGLGKNQKEAEDKGFQLITEALAKGYRNYSGILYVGRVLQGARRLGMLQQFYSQVAQFNQQFFVHLSLAYFWDGKKNLAAEYADRALALDYKIIGASGFKTLSDIYNALGDNQKRSEALLKSAP